jgi:two-component system response regulator YesN
MKILIAEDEENIADGIACILKNHQTVTINVAITLDGQEALNKARCFHPDLVITDIRMQLLNGLDLVKTLKQENICNKFIILSGYDKFTYAQTALRCGVLDYLLKPVDKQRLLELVDQVYQNLPNSYAESTNRKLPNIPFFNLELEVDTYPRSLKKVIDYVIKNYMKDISLQTISDELLLHTSYISSLINKHAGISFTYLLDYIRIKKAAELLLYEPDISVAEVSYLVGYNNERRLYHAFKKYLNCTPGDFKLCLVDEVYESKNSK